MGKKRLWYSIFSICFVFLMGFAFVACDDEPTIKDIKLDITNAKLEFEWEEEFSSEGLKVTKIMSDDTSVVVSDEEYFINSDSYDKNTPGTYKIKVTLRNTELSLTYSVTVKEKPAEVPVALELDTSNCKKDFEWGVDFSHENLKVSKITNWHQKYELQPTEYEVRCNDYDKNVAGNYTVTVKLKNTNISATYTVNVLDRPAAKIKSIRLVLDDVKQVFAWNESFNYTGLKVFKTDTWDRETELSLSYCTIVVPDGARNGEAGVYEIVVKANEDVSVKASYNVTINARPAPSVTGIEIDTTNVKKTYNGTEDFDITGLVVTKVMDYNGNITAKEGEYTVSHSFVKDSEGIYTITISLGSFQKTFDVEVLPATITGIEASNQKTTFTWGEEFTVGSSIVVKHIMSYGNPVTLKQGEYQVDSSLFNANVTGKYKIYIKTLDGKYSQEYEVEVGKAPVQSVEVNNVNRYYPVSAPFDLTTENLTLTLADNSTELAQITSGMYVAPDMSTSGRKEVVITYSEGITTTFSFYVADQIVEKQTVEAVQGKPQANFTFENDKTYIFNGCTFNGYILTYSTGINVVFDNCTFKAAVVDSAGGKCLYIPSFVNLEVLNSTFSGETSTGTESSAGYGIDLNIFNTNAENVIIRNNTFNIKGTANNGVAISIKVRGGETDCAANEADGAAKTPGTLKNVVIEENTFTADNNRIYIGTNPKVEPKTSPNFSTGNFDVEVSNNKTDVYVYERYILDSTQDTNKEKYRVEVKQQTSQTFGKKSLQADVIE